MFENASLAIAALLHFARSVSSTLFPDAAQGFGSNVFVVACGLVALALSYLMRH